MVFRKLSLKASALVLILLLGMVFLAGCGAKETSAPSQPEKTIEDTKQNNQEPAPEPSKETSAQEPVEEPASSNQGTQENSSASLPKIPHAADESSDCLSCHKEGINGAPKTPHPERLGGCFACHSD